MAKRDFRWLFSGAIALSAIGAASLLLTSFGASAAASGSGPVQVTFWESHSAGGPPGKAVQYLVGAFNRTHHGIHVNLTITKASHKALGALAAGDAPVLAMISHYDGNFLNAHALVSLNSLLFKGKGAMTTAQQRSIFPVVFGNGEVSGQHYRLQADAKVSQLSYNRALFAKAGITAIPATWTELAADVAILKHKFPNVVPLAWKDSSAHILPPFLSNGGHIFTPGSNGKKVDFLGPAAVRTFNYFRGLYQKGEMILAHGSQIRADFASGKLAIADGTSAGYQKLLDAVAGRFPVGVFAYPSGTTGHSANLAQGLGFVVMVNNTKLQDQAAAAFIKWWFSPTAQAYWGTRSGYPPETTSALADIPSSFMSSHPGIAVAIKILRSPYTIARPNQTAYKEVQAVLDAEFYDAVTGHATVESALHTLQTQSNDYLSGQSAL